MINNPFFRPGLLQTRIAFCASLVYVGVATASCFAPEAAANEQHPAPLGAPTAFTGLASGTGTTISAIGMGSIGATPAALMVFPLPNAMGDAPVEQYRGAPAWWGQAGERGSLTNMSSAATEGRWSVGSWSG